MDRARPLFAYYPYIPATFTTQTSSARGTRGRPWGTSRCYASAPCERSSAPSPISSVNGSWPYGDGKTNHRPADSFHSDYLLMWLERPGCWIRALKKSSPEARSYERICGHIPANQALDAPAIPVGWPLGWPRPQRPGRAVSPQPCSSCRTTVAAAESARSRHPPKLSSRLTKLREIRRVCCAYAALGLTDDDACDE